MRRLAKKDVEQMVYRYSHEGWTISHLAHFYHVHHSAIQYHVQNIKRVVAVTKHCPEEVASIMAPWSRIRRNRPRNIKTYEEYRKDSEDRDARRRQEKQSLCPHHHLALIVNGKHLEPNAKLYSAEELADFSQHILDFIKIWQSK